MVTFACHTYSEIRLSQLLDHPSQPGVSPACCRPLSALSLCETVRGPVGDARVSALILSYKECSREPHFIQMQLLMER